MPAASGWNDTECWPVRRETDPGIVDRLPPSAWEWQGAVPEAA